MPLLTGYCFRDLPEDIRSSLEDRPVKIIVLNDKSDLQVRFDLFERLNTGGVKLTPQEVRECVYCGEFMDCIAELADSPEFRAVIRLPESNWKDGTPEDYALRFFAFLEGYQEFNHSVTEFINTFAELAVANPRTRDRKRIFVRTFTYLSKVFPEGLKTRKGMTPVNLFEAIAVGAALALSENPKISVADVSEWIKSDLLRKLTTGPTNSRPRVRGRIEFCRDKFLGRS